LGWLGAGAGGAPGVTRPGEVDPRGSAGESCAGAGVVRRGIGDADDVQRKRPRGPR